MEKHDLLAELKRIAGELGHAPSRRQWDAHSQISRYQVDRLFSNPGSQDGWGNLLKAAGLEVPKTAKKRLTAADVFGANIREIIESKQAPVTLAIRPDTETPRIIAVGDTHFPFVSVDCLSRIYEIIDRKKPEYVIQMGDLYDMFSHSKFPRSRNIYNPADEMELGHEMALKFWDTVKRLVPAAKLFQIKGNHDERPLKRLLDAYPEGEIFFSTDRFFTFDRVHTHFDVRTPLILPYGIHAIHGFRSDSAGHWLDFPAQNILHAHSHNAKVTMRNFGTQGVKTILDCGFVGNPHSKVMTYTPLKTLKETLGCGEWDQDGARFIAA